MDPKKEKMAKRLAKEIKYQGRYTEFIVFIGVIIAIGVFIICAKLFAIFSFFAAWQNGLLENLIK